MKKNVIVVMACVGIYVLSFVLTGIVMGAGEEPTVSEAAMITPEPAVEEVPCYTVSEYHGVVAVFFGNDIAPMLETEIPVSGLRENDRAMVEEGIAAESYNEVLCLLEDFGS